MLKEIRIKNFKSLKDTGNLEIKPITLLVGPNSSGKSSIIQFLLLVKQTVESRDIENPLIFNGTCIQLESYENIIYRNNSEKKLEFEVSFDLTGNFKYGVPQVKYSATFCKKDGKVSVSCFSITGRGDSEPGLSILLTKEGNYSVIGKFKNLLEPPFRFLWFYPDFFSTSKHWIIAERKNTSEEVFSDALLFTRFFSELFSKGICYLGPLREYPRRYYPVSGAIMEDVGFKGERTIDVLATAEADILEKVQKWIKIFDMAKSMKIEPLKEKKTLVEILLEDPKMELSFNLYDVGFGVSQVLPIIVEGFYAQPGSLILIEQPEIHLHPKLQSEMGDLLIDIARSDKKLIIETHSEHLLLRIQRRITEGTLKSNDVAIYFFNYTNDGTRIERIDIDDLGRFKNWPTGFFEEDVEESFAITKAFLNRKKEKEE